MPSGPPKPPVATSTRPSWRQHVPDPQGFLLYDRKLPARRPVPVRIQDWREVYPSASDELIREQATRCMDCGVPFCHQGCPLGNRIPDWNDLVRTGQWEFAIEQLHATNNFPEFTGRLCPAPCEAACVLAIAGGAPVTIKQIEVEIINRAFDLGYVTPQPAPEASGRSAAVVGSGPAGLAAAQQLARAGHAVTVYERDDELGGLMRYGIPDFKLEKCHIDRRLDQLRAEGVAFVTSCAVGVDITVDELRARHDAVLLAAGALAGREVPEVPGRHLPGVHLAMEHLVPANRVVAGKQATTPIDAAGKHVVIIGGGDTAADCLGVAHRQGAASVTQLDLYPLPPRERDEARYPWPTWPWILRAYLVLLAIGFDGTEEGPLLDQLGLARNARGGMDCGPDWQTPVPGVFIAGDMHRGASLIVWAIAEGRAAAAAMHTYLGGAGALP